MTSGKHVLSASSSHFGPKRTSTAPCGKAGNTGIIAARRSRWGNTVKKALSRIVLSLAVVCGFASAAQAQQAKLFFEGDIVRGDQDGAPGPGCVLNSQFKHLEKVVWRLRILDASGKPLDDKGLKSLVVELPDGQKLPARFGVHPPPRIGPAVDHFWTARWIIPTEYPSGSFYYKVTATNMDGSTQTWEPFKSLPSRLAVLDGAIEIKK
jgi:hypothetical protein